MALHFPAVGTRGLHTREDLNTYLDAFNHDDYDTYTRYYHENFRMNIEAIQERDINGFVKWATHTHQHEVAEEVVPRKIIFDKTEKFVVIDSVVKFRGRKSYVNENWNGLGPIQEGTGPDVRMVIFYRLDDQARVLEIEAAIAGPVPK
ncbi:hypothetical protein LTR84_000197 [Exophiala bonariae]|uniref:SnoaL-like domain-containing protein n=1 Tax=Exophiala bonariae TaxID=1690606 RepID=A0AAV9NPU5_9EURO|nr:hypothetical protein LTR84_000197 [Exophiala bonariae]